MSSEIEQICKEEINSCLLNIMARGIIDGYEPSEIRERVKNLLVNTLQTLGKEDGYEHRKYDYFEGCKKELEGRIKLFNAERKEFGESAR